MVQVDIVYSWCGSPTTDYCKFNYDLELSLRSCVKNLDIEKSTVFILVDDRFSDTVLENTWRTILGRKFKLQIVKHSEFIPKKFLKTGYIYNSNVIESWIHQVKNLSEHFIYLNDDMYIGKRVTIDTFFYKNENKILMPILRHDQGAVHHGPVDRYKPYEDYARMWANAHSTYNIRYTRTAHNAQPYKKSILKNLYKQWKLQVDQASENKFRSAERDFNLLRFSLPLAVSSGDAILRITSPEFDYFTESNDKIGIAAIPKIRPTFFCINNSIKTEVKMLAKYFK